MPSLRQIITVHAPVLLLDAASTRIQVGWFEGSTMDAVWETSFEEAGVGVFECIEKLAIDPQRVGSFIFCDGPGSILGIRTTAMAIRTWTVSKSRPVFTYQSLKVVACSLARNDVTVIADARRDRWHALTSDSTLRRVPTAELVGTIVMPEGFRHWTPLPGGTSQTPYLLREHLVSVIDRDIIRPTDSPDAFLHEEPAYAKWSPQIHRAP